MHHHTHPRCKAQHTLQDIRIQFTCFSQFGQGFGMVTQLLNHPRLYQNKRINQRVTGTAAV